MVYYYHGTTNENLMDIALFGLRPRDSDEEPTFDQYRRQGLFITSDLRRAYLWANGRRASLAWKYDMRFTPFVLRFNSKVIRKGVKRDEMAGAGSLVVDEVVAPEHIELYDRGKWVTIRDYLGV